MIAEAIDTAYTIGWAIVAWIVIIAAAVTAVLVAVVLGIDWAWRAITWPARAKRANERTDAHDYREAA
ncbi:hypothetical protein ACH40F_08085 [Streptomyces sp. NPDC020794]|uniref:hypothetical protein n=1 Tax=unclassified Streptomyces TaxID=2593676 RepID=UPI0036E39D30